MEKYEAYNQFCQKLKHIIGIKSIKRDMAPEIESPYRKRKTLGSMKISLTCMKWSST